MVEDEGTGESSDGLRLDPGALTNIPTMLLQRTRAQVELARKITTMFACSGTTTVEESPASEDPEQSPQASTPAAVRETKSRETQTGAAATSESETSATESSESETSTAATGKTGSRSNNSVSSVAVEESLVEVSTDATDDVAQTISANNGASAAPHVGATGDVPAESDLPLASYDSLSASQVVPRLALMNQSELLAIQQYEQANRHRQTILNRCQQLLDEA